MGRNKEIGDLARALKAPAFQNPDASPDLAGLDPVSPTTLVLSIAEIKAYEHNPRLAENFEYPRLKDSIRTRRGLTTSLTVTKRPGDALYTIAAGGNSRLKALKELADETGDDAFALVTCRFEPWDSECQVFANHLIENDVRGSMTFGDKARAVAEWQRLYEETHPDEPPLSQRELLDRLSEAGYRIQQSMIARLLNTARFLLPNLPTLFATGLGRPAAERLLRLRDCGERYWADAVPSTPRPEFNVVFAEACAEHDCHCADWDHDLFQSALTARLARALELDHKLVALDIDSLYRGHDARPPDTSTAARAPDPQGLNSQWGFERSREIDTIRMERARARIGERPAPETYGDESEDEPAGHSSDTDGTTPSEKPRLDPARLRQGNYLAARELAAPHDLDRFVKPIGAGFGFFVEAPEPSEVSDADKDRPTGPAQGLVLAGPRSSLWWLLCHAADQLAAPALASLAKDYPASWLVELFTELPKRSPDKVPDDMLQILVGEPCSRSIVWDVLTDPVLADASSRALDRLLDGCRALRARANEGSVVLWEAAQ